MVFFVVCFGLKVSETRRKILLMWPSVMVTAAHSLPLERPSVSIVAAAHVVLVRRMTLCCLSLALRKKNTGSAVISGLFL